MAYRTVMQALHTYSEKQEKAWDKLMKVGRKIGGKPEEQLRRYKGITRMNGHKSALARVFLDLDKKQSKALREARMKAYESRKKTKIDIPRPKKDAGREAWKEYRQKRKKAYQKVHDKVRNKVAEKLDGLLTADQKKTLNKLVPAIEAYNEAMAQARKGYKETTKQKLSDE